MSEERHSKPLSPLLSRKWGTYWIGALSRHTLSYLPLRERFSEDMCVSGFQVPLPLGLHDGRRISASSHRSEKQLSPSLVRHRKDTDHGFCFESIQA